MKHQILKQLVKGAESASNLALILEAPQPSIRRAISQLRSDGHNISFSGDGANQIYRLLCDCGQPDNVEKV